MKRFINFINEVAPPPDTWDRKIFDKSFKAQLQYALDRSKRIGQGSSRVVFEIEYEGRPTVLKIAKNKKGLAQNNKEADYSLYKMYPDITIPMIDFDEEHNDRKWIHFEKAEKMWTKSQFLKKMGFTFENFTDLLYIWERTHEGKQVYRNFHISNEAREKIMNSEIFNEVTGLIVNFGIKAADLRARRNWGVYKDKPVIIDLGFDDEVAKLYGIYN